MGGESNNMAQQEHSQGQFAVSNSSSDAANCPDMLIDKKRLFLKPLTISQIATIPQLPSVVVTKGADPALAETDLCDQPTVPLERVIPRGTSTRFLHTSMSISHLNWAPAFPQNQPDRLALDLDSSLNFFKHAGELIWYTLAAGFIMVIYMLTPLSMVLIPLLSNNWFRLLIALEILGIIEFIIFRILMRTTQS